MGYYLRQPQLSAHEQAVQDMVLSNPPAYQSLVNGIFCDAILEANGGVIPTDEELREWCRTVVLEDGTHKLMWKAPTDELDEAYVIASVPPPDPDPH